MSSLRLKKANFIEKVKKRAKSLHALATDSINKKQLTVSQALVANTVLKAMKRTKPSDSALSNISSLPVHGLEGVLSHDHIPGLEGLLQNLRDCLLSLDSVLKRTWKELANLIKAIQEAIKCLERDYEDAKNLGAAVRPPQPAAQFVSGNGFGAGRQTAAAGPPQQNQFTFHRPSPTAQGVPLQSVPVFSTGQIPFNNLPEDMDLCSVATGYLSNGMDVCSITPDYSQNPPVASYNQQPPHYETAPQNHGYDWRPFLSNPTAAASSHQRPSPTTTSQNHSGRPPLSKSKRQKRYP